MRPTTARLLQLSRRSSRQGLRHLISRITMHIGKEKTPPISILVSAMTMPLSIWTTGIRSAYNGELKSMNSSVGECLFEALRHGREIMALEITYSERMSGLVDTEGKIFNLPSPLFAHNLFCLLGRNILVVKTLGCFRGWLLNVRLSLPAKECSKVVYEGPALEILAGVNLIQK